MWDHIRLADRRGVLSRPGPSRVQKTAAEILMVADDLFGTAGKAITLAERPMPKPKVDVSFLNPQGAQVEELTEENADDDEGVIWKMPEMDPVDAMEILNNMERSGSLGAEDLSGLGDFDA